MEGQSLFDGVYEFGLRVDSYVLHPTVRNLITLVLLFFFDKVLSRHLDKKRRWFRIHAFANLLVVLTSVNSVRATFADPFNTLDNALYPDKSMFGTASKWPLAIINTVHVYHMLAFSLTSADYFHHLLFIPLLGFPGQYFDWGAAGNFQAFFISGLPGGIDYFLLSLSYDKLGQKLVSANLNVWCRMPGLMMCAFIVYQSLLYQTPEREFPPFIFVLAQLVLPPYNALYYCKQAVANFAVHYMMEQFKSAGKADDFKMSQRTSKVTGGQVFSFDMSRPQRGS